jgi:hypothetical protein
MLVLPMALEFLICAAARLMICLQSERLRLRSSEFTMMRLSTSSKIKCRSRCYRRRTRLLTDSTTLGDSQDLLFRVETPR